MRYNHCMKNQVSASAYNFTEDYKFHVFGDRLVYAMTIRNISRQDLADRIYSAPSTISGYRIGRRSPDVRQLASIARELNISLDFLLGLTDDDSKLFPD
jgi:transcriptional regulator with XRE-family HTH domain